MDQLTIKSPEELKIMAEGGYKLGLVKKELRKAVKEGIKASDIENLAVKLFKKEGAEPSFMKVAGYHWATCININSGLVHGIPRSNVVFEKGDVVSVDVGLFYKGFHSDTSFTVDLDSPEPTKEFLRVGKLALEKSIQEARVGNKIYDISRAMEEVIVSAGYTPIRALSGHGVGRKLHEDPVIPCFFNRKSNLTIKEGMALAIEVMYAMGGPEVVLEKDGWTISMRDGKISALYEETVAVTKHGPLVLTKG